jgi:HEPN domain-containing protein
MPTVMMMTNRALDWMAQAERDLEHAREARSAARHEWACFACHQAAGKGLKALHLCLGQEAWGHVVARLLRDLPSHVAIPPALVDKAHVLDGHYVATRYPNGHVEGAPYEHYGSLQSEEALRYAGDILDLVRAEMARSRDG